MKSKVQHIGFQLNADRPVDKEVINILNSLPHHESKCSFIRKAIIFYSENMDKSFEDTDLRHEILDMKEMINKLLESRVPDTPTEESGTLKVNADAELDPGDLEDALADFLD